MKIENEYELLENLKTINNAYQKTNDFDTYEETMYITLEKYTPKTIEAVANRLNENASTYEQGEFLYYYLSIIQIHAEA